MELTPRAKQRLALFGKGGVLASLSGTIGIIVGIVAGGVYLKAQGQNLLITPVVEKAVSDKVDAAKASCTAALIEHSEKQSKINEKQTEINEKILDKLSELSVITAELRTEARIMNRKRRED